MKKLDVLIRLEHTGEPEFLAKQLEISRSVLYRQIKQMLHMGARICYSKKRKTFYYKEKVIFLCCYLKQTKTTEQALKHKINFESVNSDEIQSSSQNTTQNSGSGQTKINFNFSDDDFNDLRINPLP